jgi:hypothetical protein
MSKRLVKVSNLFVPKGSFTHPISEADFAIS